MRLAYPGPHPSVTLPATGQECPAGEPVDVPDDLAPSLLAQGWTEPKPPKAGKPGKPDAAPAADPKD